MQTEEENGQLILPLEFEEDKRVENMNPQLKKLLENQENQKRQQEYLYNLGKSLIGDK